MTAPAYNDAAARRSNRRVAATRRQQWAETEAGIRGLVPNAKRNGLKPSEFVALVRRVHGVPITTEWARELLA